MLPVAEDNCKLNKRRSNVSFNDAALVAADQQKRLQERKRSNQHELKQRRSITCGGGGGGGGDKIAQNELTVCDITGDWGLYQWSVCLFALIYSACASVIVVFGPLLTPQMGHSCNSSAPPLLERPPLEPGQQQQQALVTQLDAGSHGSNVNLLDNEHQCFKTFETDLGELISQKCTTFTYNEADLNQYGLLLTNKFDLVCDHLWLRSLVSSASLAGMLLSSVTLGLFSDKFGRLRCLQLSFTVSLIANIIAIFSHNYYLFCACIMFMSFAQVGGANALCTMVMEATSPRFRFVPVLEYGIGWGLGMFVAPILNNLTHDYRWLMGAMLAWQLLMLPWLHWGVFESIRWLLSEGHFNRAQIELRRAYRFNRVSASAQLAQDIALLQAQQVRKASRVIGAQMAPVHLARAMGTKVDETARELDMLSAAINKSFFGVNDDDDDDDDDNGGDDGKDDNNNTNGCSRAEHKCNTGAAGDTARPTPTQLIAGRNVRLPSIAIVGSDNQQSQSDDLSALSPTLARMSFCVAPPTFESISGQAILQQQQQQQQQRQQQQQLAQIIASKSKDQLSAMIEADSMERRNSITTQGLIALAIKYSKTVQRSDEGTFFLVQMFHKKLWRNTVVLLCISIMYETSYYGFLQASKFVGNNVDLNFYMGGLTDWLAALGATLMLAYCSRKLSLISTTLIGSLICLGMALSYHMIPDVHYQPPQSTAHDSGGGGLSLLINGGGSGAGGEHVLNAEEASKLLANLQNSSAATAAATTLTAADTLIDNEANLEPISSVNLLIDEIELLDGANNVSVLSSPSLSPSSSPSSPSSSSANFNYDQVAISGTGSGSSSLVAAVAATAAAAANYDKLIELRHTINFYLMHAGKFTLSVGIQVAATIAMEAYPNNLRQTGSGAILFAGRLGSILAPFLYNDPSDDKRVLKLTLVVMAAIGLLVCLFVPAAIKDNKDKELCDQMNEIDNDGEDGR